MNTVSRIQSDGGDFEASYSIQLSYGRASRQVTDLVTGRSILAKQKRNASISLRSPRIHHIRSCHLWDFCGVTFSQLQATGSIQN
jgi:hypothetical protein